uniref:Uncharacterized protein n=1 Tax=Steinernema glaseri TaxID=37863 RepID=A0A1I7ZNG7_9BILA
MAHLTQSQHEHLKYIADEEAQSKRDTLMLTNHYGTSAKIMASLSDVPNLIRLMKLAHWSGKFVEWFLLPGKVRVCCVRRFFEVDPPLMQGHSGTGIDDTVNVYAMEDSRVFEIHMELSSDLENL